MRFSKASTSMFHYESTSMVVSTIKGTTKNMETSGNLSNEPSTKKKRNGTGGGLTSKLLRKWLKKEVDNETPLTVEVNGIECLVISAHLVEDRVCLKIRNPPAS